MELLSAALAAHRGEALSRIHLDRRVALRLTLEACGRSPDAAVCRADVEAASKNRPQF